ncbi:hypothetical protein MHK_001222 [Candidatus Magnetomorum sp. HK-1]|nr:hypothetical protein MHK_001222 [Candidatus Magnetomorum sp. HK-1]
MQATKQKFINPDQIKRLKSIATQKNVELDALITQILDSYIELNEDTPESKIKAFKAAYDKIGNGRGFVRIHKIRERLKWSQKEFEKVLKDLIHDLTIEVSGGDPSIMSEKEIEDSYIDPRTGFLFITLTWWGKEDLPN